MGCSRMTEKDFLNMIRDEKIKLEAKKENLEEALSFIMQ